MRAARFEALLDRLVGHWRMTGTVRGKPVSYTMDASRVLQRRFVELHMLDVNRPPAYEARVFIGGDLTGGGFIVHWLDNFGATYSIPHAVGRVRGDTLQFTFDYADGPFRDTFVYDFQADRWHFLLESGDSTGTWKTFADYQVTRHPGKPPN